MRMRSIGACYLCAALVGSVPIVEASGLIRSVARYCLRNVAASFTCYVFSRGGELIVDSGLTAAWNKAFAGQDQPGPPPNSPQPDKKGVDRGTPAPNPKLAPRIGVPSNGVPSQAMGPLSEPLGRREVGSLAEKLVKQGALKDNSRKVITEGFVIYPSDGSGKIPAPPLFKRQIGQVSARESACRNERELALGLTTLRIVLAPAPEREKLHQRRLNEVILACAGK